MFKQIFLTLTVLIFSLTLNPLLAQENFFEDNSKAKSDSLLKLENPRQFLLDSIKNTFIDHDFAAFIDNNWLKDYNTQDLFHEMWKDIENFDGNTTVDYDLPTELLKERLAILDAQSAFDIKYNPVLENVIKYYLKNRKSSMERFLGLSSYYFPVYEDILAKHNVPLEIKYLSIVESALNPKAVSRVGATGLWQFMYATGKEYGLKIDTYVDERSDLLLSTNAACEYMKRMHKLFNDWDLVLASYNAGPGNVSKAIRRSGGKTNYWNIRPFLPKETQGYVPAFIATMYVMEFHKEHQLVPKKPSMKLPLTDTLLVKNKISFKQLSDMLDVSVEELAYWNPSYKRNVIPNVDGTNYYLRLPLELVGKFVSNEDKIYAFANLDFNHKEQPFQNTKQTDTDYAYQTSTKYHKVKKGETLSGVAKKYGVTMSQIKQWNGLKSNTLKYGHNLKINTVAKVKTVTKVEEAIAVNKPKETKTAITTQNQTIDNDSQPETETKIVEYTVLKGDNLNSIAKKHQITVSQLREWNQLETNIIKEGDVFVVKKEDIVLEKPTNEELIAQNKPQQFVAKPKQNKKDEIYTVKKGDTLSKISKQKGVTINDLKKWNGIKSDNIKVGTKLKIKA